MPRKSLYVQYQNTHSLLPNEAWDLRSSWGIFAASSTPEIRDQRAMARSLLSRPGRFRSPLNLGDKLKLWLQSVVAIDFFQLSQFTFLPPTKNPIAYPWQVLLRYLKREGVIREAWPFPCYFLHDQPRILSLRLDAKDSNLHGRGNAADFETTLSKSVGELLERIFLSRKYRNFARRASIAQLEQAKTRFLHPSTLAQTVGTTHANPESLTSPKIEWHWVMSHSLLDGEPVLMPAQAVFMGGPFVGEPLLREGNSNGSAGGFTLLEAALAGLYELIERDSFLVFWFNNIAPPVVDVSQSANPELQWLLAQVKRYRLEAVFLNTTTDTGIPACVCILIDRAQGKPGLSLGGGAGWDVDSMLLGSLREAIIVYGGNDYLADQPEIAEGEYRPHSDAKFGLTDRITLWKNPAMFTRFEFFLRGKRQTLTEAFGTKARPMRVRDEYTLTLDHLRVLGTAYTPYVYEAEHRVLDTLGYHVVKVVVPALLSLNLIESNAPLGAKRLTSAPLAMGYQPAETPNPWPHPFP